MKYQYIIPTRFGSAVATNVTGTLYTVPVESIALVKDIDIANTTAGALSITIYLVPSGGLAGASTSLFGAASVPANSTMQWTGTQVLAAGGTIQILNSGANGLTVTASGGVAT